jgi:muramidase (phage lysozyme)
MAKTSSIIEAAPLLALIRKTETGHEGAKAYETLYGYNQHKLTKPLTRMTVDEVISAGPGWTRSHVSSAAGAYQFMHATLKDLKNSEGLTGREVFDAKLQDRLGFALLNRRGFQGFMAGTVSRVAFGLGLAREWASFPVLAGVKGQKRSVARGETYYAGDGLNKALVKPETVEAALDSLLGAKPTPIPTAPLPDAKPGGINPIGVIAAIIILAAIAAAFFVRF